MDGDIGKAAEMTQRASGRDPVSLASRLSAIDSVNVGRAPIFLPLMRSRWLPRVIGAVLLVLSFYFIIEQLWEHRSGLLVWRPTGPMMVVFAGGAIVYGLAGFLLSSAWGRVLHANRTSKVQSLRYHWAYGVSQIAKYIPGNVFHFASRHILGRQIGVSHGTLLVASVVEAIGLILVATTITLIGILAFGIPDLYMPFPITVLILATVIALAFWHVSSMRGATKHQPQQPSEWPKLRLTLLRITAPYYAGFFLLAGLLLALLSSAVSGHFYWAQLPGMLATFSAAWLLGFVTPGAPGGLGIREVVLVLLLAPIVGDEQGLLVALLFRVMTLLGDSVFFSIVQFIGWRHRGVL